MHKLPHEHPNDFRRRLITKYENFSAGIAIEN